MSTTQIMWSIIVIIVVVVVILAVAFYFGRKRQLESHRTQAAELRETAKNDELSAREVEADAAQADADAKQSEVDAARSRQEANQRLDEAQTARAHSQDQSRKADELDPDIDVRHRRKVEPDGSPAVMEQPAADDQLETDRSVPRRSETDRYDVPPGTDSNARPF